MNTDMQEIKTLETADAYPIEDIGHLLGAFTRVKSSVGVRGRVTNWKPKRGLIGIHKRIARNEVQRMMRYKDGDPLKGCR